MTVESGGSEAPEEQSGVPPSEMPPQQGEEMTEVQPAETSAPAAPQPEGRRTQLKIVRESIQSLEREVGVYRRSHEASTRKLEAHLAQLRKDMTTHMHSKDLGNHAKRHESDTKRLEKQISALRGDLASMKGQMAKEAARSRAREEAFLSKVAAKVKKAQPARKPKKPQKPSKGKR